MAIALAFLAIVVIALLVATGGAARFSPPNRDGGLKPAAPHTEWVPIGIRFFSGIAGLALILGALYGGGSIAGAMIGVALVIASELPFVRKYAVTANAMAGAGIGILFGTLYAIHLPLVLRLLAMAVVTAVAVYLAVRRNSFFIALLGLIGGFAAPALLGFTENLLPLFAYLLLLNVGIAWVAYRKGWPLLLALTVTLTALYEWAWVLQYMNSSQLALAAAMFAVLAAVGASPFWFPLRGEHPITFQRIASAAALLPLLFALYLVVVPNYAQRYNILFGFLFVVAAGLAFVVWRGAPRWLHVAGGVATLLIFLLWFIHWFMHLDRYQLLPVRAVPGLVLCVSLWLAAFVLLYLLRDAPFAPLLFFVFIGLAIRQPQDSKTLILVMLALLALVVIVMIARGRPIFAAIAIAFASLALMAFNPLPALYPLFPAHALSPMPPVALLFIAHSILFFLLFAVAWISRRPVLAIIAVAFYAGMVITANSPAASPLLLLVIAIVPYAMFVVYALANAGRSLAPSIAVALASVVFFLSAWAALVDTPWSRFFGAIPLLVALVMLVLLLRMRRTDPREPGLTLVASAALVFLNAAILLLLPKEWVVMLWAVEAAALMWLFRRFAHPALVVWAAGLGAVVFVWLTFDADFYPPLLIDRAVFGVAALGMFAAAYFTPAQMPGMRLYFSLAGLIASWFRVNIEIANCYQTTGGPVNFALSSQREDVTYTIAWAVIATGLLLIGLIFHWRGARVGATGLLLAAIFKAFLHDLSHLGGVYRVWSLIVLGVSLVIVGLALQKFVTSAASPRMRSAP